MAELAEHEWEEIAKNLLQREKEIKKYIKPEPISALIEWRNRIYFGHIQEISKLDPNCSREIVLLSKTSKPLTEGLIRAISKLDSKRVYLHIDKDLDIEGRQYIARRIETRLTLMNPE